MGANGDEPRDLMGALRESLGVPADRRAQLRAALAAYERARATGPAGAYTAAMGTLFDLARNALPELLDAADERDRLRAEIDRRVAAGTKATVDAVSALSQRCGELAAELLDARRSGFDEHEKTRAALRVTEDQRDSARATAMVLEQQNAVLLETADEVTRKRADAARATGPDPWADVAELRAFVRWINEPFPADITDAEVVGAIQVRASAVLARTDPLRDEDGGEDRD